MKKLFYLIIVMVVLGLIVSGCLPVVPPSEQDEPGTLPNKASGDVWYVPGDYDTIQDAINAAAGGETIIVAAGTYNERVVIDKPLTLLGEDKDTTIIDGTGMTATDIPPYGNNGILIFPGAGYHTKDVGITISGFTVQNFAVIGAGGGAGIATDGTYQYKNITISDVIAKDNGMAGLEVSRALDSHFSNIVVDNNDQYGNGQGYGIWIMYDTSNSEFTNIVATNQVMGIYVLQANDNTFNNVNCTENAAGVYFSMSNGNTVENSSMNNNTYGGVYFNIANNNTVENSSMSGNGIRGAKCYSGVNNQIHCSNIEGNEAFGVESLVDLDATHNWWGHATGPLDDSNDLGGFYNPYGQGDEVSDYVDYSNWAYIPDFCDCEAKTIGYWKNHPDWLEGIFIELVGTIEVGTGKIVDFADAMAIFTKPKSTTYSMLAAQLLAAKLNVAQLSQFFSEPDYDFSCQFDIGGGESMTVIEAAEAADLILVGDCGYPYNKRVDKGDKERVNIPKSVLDDFNNNGCPLNACPCECYY